VLSGTTAAGPAVVGSIIGVDSNRCHECFCPLIVSGRLTMGKPRRRKSKILAPNCAKPRLRISGNETHWPARDLSNSRSLSRCTLRQPFKVPPSGKRGRP